MPILHSSSLSDGRAEGEDDTTAPHKPPGAFFSKLGLNGRRNCTIRMQVFGVRDAKQRVEIRGEGIHSTVYQ